ncbi:hypothetical protein G7084_01160 [Weissella coleopterorum]|uniref:Uncharacterized protein n=2 Tax=Weissella coleopterorum TaxID=2714949 RepID=A0A6G8B206_9LACO|nr:hypothetical protein G7084_01160 [Weissella coleopterorum]
MYITLMTSLFIGANLDFFILLIPLFKKHGFKNTIIGYVFGVIGMYLISATMGQFIQILLPMWVIGILGLVPIWYGIRGGDEEAKNTKLTMSIFTVAIVYLTSCSADNLALYVPVLSTLSINQSVIYGLYFIVLAIMTGILAHRISNIRVVTVIFDKFGDIITRIIYIGIGLFVIIESGLLNKILNLLF